MNWAMRRFAPGSFGWLFFHELRVAMRGGKRPLRTRVIGLLVLLALIAGGSLAAAALRDVPIAPDPFANVVVLTAAIGLLSFMTTQAMIGSQRTLYERADLDLLFSAPIDPTRVLLAKLCGIAGNIVFTYAVLVLPFAIPIAAMGHPGLFGIPLVLIALALVAACIGLAITLVLARLAGPRTARTVGQIAAAVLGGAMFIVSQVLSHDDVRRRSGLMLLFERFERNGLATHGIGAWPGRAALGEPLALVAMLGGAMALFVVTGIVFRRLFLSGFQDAGKHLSRAPRSTRATARHFRAGLFGSVFRKEWLLLARDPALAFQIVLRLIYIAPIMFAALGGEHAIPLAPSLAFLSVVIAGQLVGSFAWLTIAAEDTPDLIMVAPVEKAAIDRIKLMTALAMATPLAVILPIAIATETVAGALATLAFTAIGGALAGLIELKLGKPMPRKTFGRRRSGSLLVGLLTFAVTIVCGGLAGGAVYLLA